MKALITEAAKEAKSRGQKRIGSKKRENHARSVGTGEGKGLTATILARARDAGAEALETDLAGVLVTADFVKRLAGI